MLAGRYQGLALTLYIGSMQHPSGAKYEVSPSLVLTYNRTVLVITGRVC